MCILTQEIIGILREYSFDRLKDSDRQWIRDVYFFDECHFLIICCTYAQAKAFTKVQCIEMDMSLEHAVFYPAHLRHGFLYVSNE